MKRLISLLLASAMLLSLAACGKSGANTHTEPSTLTITTAGGESITAMGGSYDWEYASGEEWMSVMACGTHPLDEVLRADMPVLKMPVAVSASSYYEVTLDFGDAAPQSVSLRRWGEECWDDFEAESETIAAERQEDGTYIAALVPSIGIFAVDVTWDTEAYRGDATYCFRTLAEGTQEQFVNECRFDATTVKKLDISWLTGNVNIQAGTQTGEILVTEQSDRVLSDGEIMYCALEGDTLSIRFLRESGGRLDAKKYLTVYFPAEMLDAAQLEEIEIESVSAVVLIAADVSQEIDISTVSGDARVMTVSCPEVEIETTSGSVGLVDGLWQKAEIRTVSGGIEIAGEVRELDIETTSGSAALTGAFGAVDFESVSGALGVTANAALALEAETTSGAVAVALPEDCGVTLRFATTSGTLDTLLTQREGTLVACGDRFEEYIIPSEPGAEACSVVVKTVSGGLTVTEQIIG